MPLLIVYKMPTRTYDKDGQRVETSQTVKITIIQTSAVASREFSRSHNVLPLKWKFLNGEPQSQFVSIVVRRHSHDVLFLSNVQALVGHTSGRGWPGYDQIAQVPAAAAAKTRWPFDMLRNGDLNRNIQ